MAWKEVSLMSQREEFVVLASVEGANFSELCRRFGVSALRASGSRLIRFRGLTTPAEDMSTLRA